MTAGFDGPGPTGASDETTYVVIRRNFFVELQKGHGFLALGISTLVLEDADADAEALAEKLAAPTCCVFVILA